MVDAKEREIVKAITERKEIEAFNSSKNLRIHNINSIYLYLLLEMYSLKLTQKA